MRALKMYLPGVISGAALIFCFPRFDLWWLAYIALVPLLISLYRKTEAEAFRLGYIAGIPYFGGTLYWIYYSMNHYGGVPLTVSVLIVILLALYLSLYTGLFGLLYTWSITRTQLPAMFLAPLFWVILEYLRTYVITGFPWSSIGYSQYKTLPVIQIADMTGVYGVSFLVVAINGAVVDFFVAGERRKKMPLFNLLPMYAGYFLLIIASIATLVYGKHRMNENRAGKNITVSVVQPNIRQDMKWAPEFQRFSIDTYKTLTDGVRKDNPDMVVWPESSMPFYMFEDKDLTDEIISYQQGRGGYLLMGALLSAPQHPNAATNSAIMLDAWGAQVYRYDKIHLVPFGEYVPLRRILFFVSSLTKDIGDFVPGREYVKAKTPFGEFGTMICYEIVFPALVRKFYKNSGDFIVTVTNDAWFGPTAGPYQHFSMAVFRAVENRKPVIRAANTGISGFIDSNGGIIGQSEIFKQAVMTERVRTDKTRSFYSRYGDLFIYVCLVLMSILVLNIRGPRH